MRILKNDDTKSLKSLYLQCVKDTRLACCGGNQRILKPLKGESRNLEPVKGYLFYDNQKIHGLRM